MKNTSKRLPLRYFRNLLLFTLAILVIVFYIILPAVQSYQAMHPNRHPIGDVSPGQLGLLYENVTLTTRDGLKLPGWYIPSQNGAAIIAVHAYNGNRTGTIYHAQLLAKHGYGVLMFDLRAHGESEGKIFPFGWNSDQDVLAALEYLRNRPEVDAQRTGALGLSIGAEILLQTAAENHDIQAVVAEGAGARTFADWSLAPGSPGKILAPGMWIFFKTGELFSGVPQPAGLEELVAKISPTRILLISAGAENHINGLYYAAAQEPKQHWARPKAGHINALFAQSQEYENTVILFFDQALLPTPSERP